jgi:hypothetical protein
MRSISSALFIGKRSMRKLENGFNSVFCQCAFFIFNLLDYPSLQIYAVSISTGALAAYGSTEYLLTAFSLDTPISLAKIRIRLMKRAVSL